MSMTPSEIETLSNSGEQQHAAVARGVSPERLKELVVQFFEMLGAELQSVSVTTSAPGHDPITGQASQRTGRTVVSVTSPASKLLIGPGGEHLRSVNILLRKLVEQKYGSEAASFLVDVNNYHENQMEEVRQSARILAQRARLFKHDVELEPMSSYERLIIHELFAEDPQIKTESAGEGKFRHIVLRYRV